MRKESKRKQSRRSTPKRPYTVFVSHATADKWIARVLCERIEAAGAAAFRDDRDIDGGDDIPNAIRTAIRRSAELVVLVTPHSVKRPWVIAEVGAAWGRRDGYRIVAVLCHVNATAIPAMIQRRKAIPLNDFDEYVTELGDRVRRHRS